MCYLTSQLLRTCSAKVALGQALTWSSNISTFELTRGGPSKYLFPKPPSHQTSNCVPSPCLNHSPPSMHQQRWNPSASFPSGKIDSQVPWTKFCPQGGFLSPWPSGASHGEPQHCREAVTEAPTSQHSSSSPNPGPLHGPLQWNSYWTP